MKYFLIATAFSLVNFFSIAQDWKPAGDKIKTAWAEKVDPNNTLQEYPRPQLTRELWQNLNGLWDYAILPKGSNAPENFKEKILVPFAVESSLSGVQKRVGENNEIWYIFFLWEDCQHPLEYCMRFMETKRLLHGGWRNICE